MDMHMENIEILANAIIEIVKQRGLIVFENAKLFCGMIDDMVPGLVKEKTFFVKRWMTRF